MGALTTTDEEISDQVVESSDIWMRHKKKMERLDAAIRCATVVSSSQPESKLQSETPSIDTRSINLSINGSMDYVIPWDACRIWPV